jgi:site-specific DNA-methyltransferase (adenine-specific)
MNELQTSKLAWQPPLVIADVIGCLSFFNADNLEIMRGFKDNEFDLAIVDPPYGIDMAQELFKRGQTCKKNGYKEHLNKDWDKQVPEQIYFTELFRISKNQIVFGANYMTKYLPESMGWIVWNKVQRDFSFADGELAWTSFKQGIKIFDYARGNESGFAPKLKGQERIGINIHPTQKPIKLYEWIVANYAKQNDKILDTHLGSGSIAIAIEKANRLDKMNLQFVGIEIDKEYYEKALNRIEQYCRQGTLSF